MAVKSPHCRCKIWQLGVQSKDPNLKAAGLRKALKPVFQGSCQRFKRDWGPALMAGLKHSYKGRMRTLQFRAQTAIPLLAVKTSFITQWLIAHRSFIWKTKSKDDIENSQQFSLIRRPHISLALCLLTLKAQYAGDYELYFMKTKLKTRIQSLWRVELNRC